MTAPTLSELKKPFVITKMNANKYTYLARKHEVEYVSSIASLFFPLILYFYDTKCI